MVGDSMIQKFKNSKAYMYVTELQIALFCSQIMPVSGKRLIGAYKLTTDLSDKKAPSQKTALLDFKLS